MKKHSNGIGIGLSVVRGLVAIYLLGAILVWLDLYALRTGFISRFPAPVSNAVNVLYLELFRFFGKYLSL
jgi:hypothetical protein